MIRIIPAVIPPEQVREALRVIHLDILRRGFSPGEWAEWRAVACVFPHLRQHPYIAGLGGLVLHALEIPAADAGDFAEPQVIFHLPDEAEQWDTPPHLDEPPPWAAHRPYLRIAGIALTDWTVDNGCLRVWLDGEPIPVQLRAGDAVVMDPLVWHANSLNRSGLPRIGVYCRWLEPAAVGVAA